MLRAEPLVAPLPSVAGHRQSLQSRKSGEIRLILVIALVHIPLGLFLYSAPSLALIHPVASFFVGMYWAVRKRYGLDRVALAAGYIIGAEVLWRMAQVPIYWEFGKIGASLIMIAALLTRRQYTMPKLPIVYFIVLIPACFVTLLESDLIGARNSLSFNMSGPFLLLVSSIFFANLMITPRQVRRLISAVVIPIISIAFITLFYSITVEDIRFTTNSNFATSGGFGPNQVSSILGLAVFLTVGVWIIFRSDLSLLVHVLLGIVVSFFTAQCVLTFSRGGIYNAVGAIAIFSVFQFRNFTDGLKRLFPVAIGLVLFVWLVLPLLNNFTGGKLQERFEDTNTTGRTEVVKSDFETFLANPVFGVGVGSSRDYRALFLDNSTMPHTELSRLLSEHGVFGIFALFSIVGMIMGNLLRQRSTLGRSLVAGISVWSILFMFNAGMRLAAPSFMLGMTFFVLAAPRPRLARSVYKRKSVYSLKTKGTQTKYRAEIDTN